MQEDLDISDILTIAAYVFIIGYLVIILSQAAFEAVSNALR